MAVLLIFIKRADGMILFTSQRKYPARGDEVPSNIIENRRLAGELRGTTHPCK
jgi:hypothetical protein